MWLKGKAGLRLNTGAQGQLGAAILHAPMHRTSGAQSDEGLGRVLSNSVADMVKRAGGILRAARAGGKPSVCLNWSSEVGACVALTRFIYWLFV